MSLGPTDGAESMGFWSASACLALLCGPQSSEVPLLALTLSLGPLGVCSPSFPCFQLILEVSWHLSVHSAIKRSLRGTGRRDIASWETNIAETPKKQQIQSIADVPHLVSSRGLLFQPGDLLVGSTTGARFPQALAVKGGDGTCKKGPWDTPNCTHTPREPFEVVAVRCGADVH